MLKQHRNLLYLLCPFLLILALIAGWNALDFAQYPDQAADGAAWDKSWEMMAKAVGIEPPGHGLTLLANNSVLAGEDTYYAAWTVGEPVQYTNVDGDEVDLYPAQLYLLLYGCADETAAGEACADFLAREKETYTVQDERTETHNAQDYTVLDYTGGSADNPYDRGSSAFAVRGNYVLVAELLAQDSFDGDLPQMLADFLDGVHYDAAL